MRHWLTAISLLTTLGCGGNPYGYAPEYVPLSEEEPFQERGLALSYEEVRRDPIGYQNKVVAWFGVVEKVEPVPGSDKLRVAMQLHFHQPRHLCTDQFDSSCRVTISDKTGGPFSAVLAPRPEDRVAGPERLQPGSLLKIYGKPLQEYDDRGGPMLATEYYRHWPMGTYVNTRRAQNMRR